jgi:hypothetical protein
MRLVVFFDISQWEMHESSLGVAVWKTPQAPFNVNVDKNKKQTPSSSHHHFYRLHVYHSQSWVLKMALFYLISHLAG